MNVAKLALLTFFLGSICQLQSQTKGFSNHIGDEARRGPSVSSIEQAAKKSTSEMDFFSAMKYYERLLAIDTTNEALLGYAESAFAYHANENSEIAYQKLIDRNGQNAAPDWVLKLADVKYHLGKYTDARNLCQNLISRGDLDSTNLEAAQSRLENAAWAMEIMEETDVDLTIDNMNEPINSEFSDFAPYLTADNVLYYSSWRYPNTKDKNNPEREIIKISRANFAGSEVSGGDLLPFNNSKIHTAHTAFSKEKSTIFYTNCTYVKTAEIRCDIFMRSVDASGNFGPEVKLPETINMPGYTNTEPAVGFDAKTNQQVLFFVSDRPGGKGKKDLWYSMILDGGNGFSEPVNVPSLNTPENDVTPFYHNETGTLYFSSTGYQTLGGYDVFKSKGKGLVWGAPEHLGHPTNSSLHDLYYFLSNDGLTAFMASNRNGARYLSEEACCLDIFKIDLWKPQVIAVTFHEETRDSLHGTQIRIIETSGTNEEIKYKVPGAFTPFPIRTSKSYMLIASKEGFISDTIVFDSPAKLKRELWVHKLYLKPARIQLIAKVFDAKTKEPLYQTTAKFQDVGAVMPGGTLASGKDGQPLSSQTKTDAGTNRYEFPIDFNHHYRIDVTKEGYTSAFVEVSTEGVPAGTVIEKILYLRRGLALVARAFDAISKEPLVGTSIRFSELTGGKRLQTGSNASGHTYDYDLDFEYKYKIVITKEGFFPDSVEFTTTGLAKIDFQTITKDLYLRPLKLVSFLPVKLYFDNDEPDKRVVRSSTTKTYGETYYAYYPRKQEFITRYLSGLSDPGEQESHRTKISDFFERDVKGGWDRLVFFTEAIRERLEKGVKVEITIKGFASPRAATDYNKKLTSRRITCVKNHFYKYKNGVLMPYIRNGSFVLTEKPFGEEMAPTGISAEIPDERNSVFSMEASRERRVEIIEVETNN